MKKAHKSNWKCVHHAEDDFEEWVVRDGHWYQDKPGECEDSAEARNPGSHLSQRDWYMMTEEDYEGMAGSYIPTYSQVLQGRSNKAEKSMTCPPIIVSDGNPHRFPWEDKPTVVMKITKRKRCKRNQDAPKDVSAPSLSSKEKEAPADSGLSSDASLIQDGHRSEDRPTKTANEMETTVSWTSGVSLREGDTPETAETKQTTVKEEEPSNIWETKVQQLEAEQNDMDLEDSGTCGQLVDKNQEVIIKSNISEMENCNRELQEAEYRDRIHQLDEGRNKHTVKNTNAESRVPQQTEDKQQLSHSYDASQEKVHQLEEHTDKVNTKMSIQEMLVLLLEDKKTEATEQKQSFVTKHEDLLQQIENIKDKEEKMEMQLHQLQQQENQLEDICGGLKKKWKIFPSIFFSKASKTEKETIAEAETEMTRGEVKKKRSKWFPLIFFSKALKTEKEAMAETEMAEGDSQRGAFVSRC